MVVDFAATLHFGIPAICRWVIAKNIERVSAEMEPGFTGLGLCAFMVSIFCVLIASALEIRIKALDAITVFIFFDFHFFPLSVGGGQSQSPAC